MTRRNPNGPAPRPRPEMVGGHGAVEARLLGRLREGEELGGRELLVGGVEADARRERHGAECRCGSSTEPAKPCPVSPTVRTFRRSVLLELCFLIGWPIQGRPASMSAPGKSKPASLSRGPNLSGLCTSSFAGSGCAGLLPGRARLSHPGCIDRRGSRSSLAGRGPAAIRGGHRGRCILGCSCRG